MRRRRLELQCVPPFFEAESGAHQPIGELVGDLVEVVGVFLDAPEALVVEIRQLRFVLAVDRPELGIFLFAEAHHLGDDGDFLGAEVRPQQLDVGAQVGVARVVRCGVVRLGCLRRCERGAGRQRERHEKNPVSKFRASHDVSHSWPLAISHQP